MINLLLFLACVIFTIRRLMTFLHVFQQEEYNGKRFIPWIIENKAFDKKMSAIIFLAFILSFFINSSITTLLLFIGFLCVAYFEKNPVKQAKKKLVLTDRAKRILGIALIISLVTSLIPSMVSQPLIWLVYVQLLPLALVASTILLKPKDKKVNASFRQEAVEKLEKLNPFIIGITGSFGKTSVKHILGHILENHAGTLITPGSVNTEMGITRIIRERLTAQHKYFIVEMGAYGIGSIRRLCNLTPPKLSIISAIGKAHLERFKNLEGTAKAKYEIAEAAIENGGSVVIHTGVLERKYAQEFTNKHAEHFIHCGKNGEFRAENVQQTLEGLCFDLKVNEDSYPVLAPIYGQHHIDNMLLSIATAHKIGMSIEDIIFCLKTVPQITHRLEVKRQPNYTIIDDAFNSNPNGFSAALDVLDSITPAGGKRILVTPGMVELGDDHESEHLRLGKKAAQTTDITIVVCPERIPSFIDGFNKEGSGATLIEMATFKEAEKWIAENAQKQDVILLENDLPDLYEDKLVI